MIKILFVEDDSNMGILLKENLGNKGYQTTWCRDGEQGLDLFMRNEFDLCILDVMLPAKDGFTLSREIRALNATVPIIFLTARTMQEDKITGFEAGADDYITKPFSAHELNLRIQAIFRRIEGKVQVGSYNEVSIGNYLFNYKKMTLQLGQEIKRLSLKESELLQIFITNKNELVDRTVMLKKIWGNDNYLSAKTMDVYISRVRRLLKDDPDIEILNAYGAGFKMIIN